MAKDAGEHPASGRSAIIRHNPSAPLSNWTLGGRDDPAGEARLYRLEENGSFELVKKAKCVAGGKFLRYQYTVFDFTEKSAGPACIS